MSNPVQIVTTTENRDDALRIARAVLVACAQVEGPITSVYRWQGAVECSEEFRVVMKSDLRIFEKIREAIVELHPYDVPEVIAISICAGSPAYLEWLEQNIESS